MLAKETRISFTLQAVLIMSVFTVIVSGVSLCGLMAISNKVQSVERPRGEPAIGQAPTESIESVYGPVNQKALLETKEGLFGRIRAARQERICANQQRQSWCSQASSYYGTPAYCYTNTSAVVVSAPKVVNPAATPAVVPAVTVEAPEVQLESPQPLKLRIQPSCENGDCGPSYFISGAYNNSSVNQYSISVKTSL